MREYQKYFDMFGRKKIPYCTAVLHKERGFNYLKYENSCDENTAFLDQFKQGQKVKLYIEAIPEKKK